MDKKCVVIDVNLAVILGVSESIIVQQMIYWLEKSTHIIEGRPWIFNSYASWQKQLPFFCESTIRRLIKKLEDMEIILSGNFNKSKMDKTKWYSINYDALNKLQEKFNAEQNVNENQHTDEIANNCINNAFTLNDNLYCDNNEQMKKTFEKKNCSILTVDETSFTKAIPEITPETNLKDVVVEIESSHLRANCKIDNTDKTVKSGADEDNGRSIEDKLTNFDAIIKFFSSNIHLPTPHECEKLRLLYEDIKNPDLIIKAMEISVENRARSFRYIESILYNWMDLSLHNLSEVQEYMQNYKEAGKNQRGSLENKGSTPGAPKERKDDNHGEKKYSRARQYSSYNKKAQGEVQGKYAGFKPEESKLPEFTEEDFAEFR